MGADIYQGPAYDTDSRQPRMHPSYAVLVSVRSAKPCATHSFALHPFVLHRRVARVTHKWRPRASSMSVGMEPLSDLMERYARGDEEVFEALYRSMAPRLHRFCRRLAVHGPEAEDLFQETFLRLHRARATYITGANVFHWAFTIARSIYLTRLRYWRRRPEELGARDDVADLEQLQPEHHATPEAEVLAEHLLEIAQDELGRMSEKNRVAYVLLKEEGLSAKEAAMVLGTTPTVVKQRAHRAYVQLRAALDAGERRRYESET